MFDLTELKKLAEKQDPFAIVILDTNVFMNDPYVYQWKTSNNFVFVISSTVHNELIVLNSSDNQEKREKAGMALKQIRPLYGSKEAIAKGIAVQDVGWFISIPDPDKDAVDKEIKKYGLLSTGLRRSDMESLLLAEECQQTLSPRTSLLATWDNLLFQALRQRDRNSFLFKGQWSELSEYVEQIRQKPEEIKETDDQVLGEALTYVYTAQYVRPDGPTTAGVLAKDSELYHSKIEELVSKKEVQAKSWYKLSGYLTTPKGREKATTIVNNRLLAHTSHLNSELEGIPRRLLQYLIQNILLADTFSVEVRPGSSESHPFHCLLANADVLETRDVLFQLLLDVKLMVTADNYVSTRRGKAMEERYVWTTELKSFCRSYLAQAGLAKALWPQDLEEMHEVFHALDLGSATWNLSDLNLKMPTEYRERVNKFIEECLTKKIITEATGSKGKPCRRIDDPLAYHTERTKRFQKPLVDFLLGQAQPEEGKKKKVEEPLSGKGRFVEGGVGAPHPSRLAILLGVSGSQDVYWTPAGEHNWNLAIVGAAGTGKTQTVKAVLGELARERVPYIVFDFKDDYVPAGSAASRFGSVLDLGQVSINPLELDGGNSPKDQKYQVSEIIDLVYTVGELQVGYIRNAIRMSYADNGIDEEDTTTWAKPAPTFADLQRNLQRQADEGKAPVKNAINGIFARLDPIFDYRVFSARTVVPFQQLIAGQTIVNLGQLKNDTLKAVVVEFLLRKLRYYLYTLPDSRDPRMFVVIDEAHRLKYDREASAGRLLKEARSKGVGLLLATQDPVDFTDVVYNNIGGILSLCLPDPPYAKKVAEHLGGKVTWQDVKNSLSGKFSAFVKFSSRPEAIRLQVTPHYQRKG